MRCPSLWPASRGGLAQPLRMGETSTGEKTWEGQGREGGGSSPGWELDVGRGGGCVWSVSSQAGSVLGRGEQGRKTGPRGGPAQQSLSGSDSLWLLAQSGEQR